MSLDWLWIYMGIQQKEKTSLKGIPERKETPQVDQTPTEEIITTSILLQ